MADWLQTILVVLAVLVGLYALLVMAQIIATAVLRKQYEPTRWQIDTAQQDVLSARKRLDQLARFVASGSRDMPFGPLYDQARDLMGKASHHVGEAQRRVNAVVEERIAEEPPAAALTVVPMSREIFRRVGMRRGARTAFVQLTAFNESMARIGQIQADIAALPAREKEALIQVQQRAQPIAPMIAVEARPKQPLNDARETLKQANANLEQASRLLSGNAPTEAAVVAAHPMRLKAVAQLDALDATLAAVKDKRVRAEGALAKIDEQLRTHRGEIATEASAGFARPAFTATADEIGRQYAALAAMVASGDYDTATDTTSELQTRVAAQAQALVAVRDERARIIGMVDRSQRSINTIGQWMSETPSRFDLDRTRAAQAELQSAVDQLQALAPLEDVREMAASADLDRRVEEGFRSASAIRGEFEANRTKFDEIVNLVNADSVQTMTGQARQVAGELAKVNVNYWGDVSPEKLRAAGDALQHTWDSEMQSLTRITEGDLPNVLNRLQRVREAFLTAGGAHIDATRALTTADDDKLQAETALNDATMTRVVGEMNGIAVGSPSVADVPRAIVERIDALRQDLAQPAPDYKAVHAEAQQLRKEADAFLVDHHQRLQKARATLLQMQGRLEAHRTALKQLDGDPRIDFAPLAVPAADRVGEWLAAFDGRMHASLDDAVRALTQAESLDRDAMDVLDSAAVVGKHVDAQVQSAKTALAELNGVMTSAQAGLNAMTGGDERGGATVLDAARVPMTEALELLHGLEQPTRRLAPDDAVTTADKICALVTAARSRADDAHAEIARRVNEMRNASEDEPMSR